MWSGPQTCMTVTLRYFEFCPGMTVPSRSRRLQWGKRESGGRRKYGIDIELWMYRYMRKMWSNILWLNGLVRPVCVDFEPAKVTKSLQYSPRAQKTNHLLITDRVFLSFPSFRRSFFHFVEATEGNIIVDDVDISKIGLTDLRGRLTIILRGCHSH